MTALTLKEGGEKCAHNMQMRGRRDLARLNKQQGRGFSLVHNLSLKSLQQGKRRRAELPSTKQHSAKVQLAAGGIVQVKKKKKKKQLHFLYYSVKEGVVEPVPGTPGPWSRLGSSH